jgi:RNase P/RNase MRP subunit p29
MKKALFLLLIMSSLCVANAHQASESPLSVTNVSNSGEKITLINDSPNKLKIHTGSGEVSLNPRGGKTSFSCNPGKSVKVDGKEIFKVSEDMCGKTIMLSKYL